MRLYHIPLVLSDISMPPSVANLGTIKHGSRRGAIVAHILEAVFEGRIPSGERLKVEHLADEFGVSATPIRESLVELAGIGIVDLIPNRGAVVRPLGPTQLREICQVRRVLETEAARCACGRITPHELHGLEAEFTRLIDSPRDPQWSDATRAADTRLHDLILERCGSERLVYEIGRYRILYRAIRDILHHKRKARSDYQQMEENAEHLAIVRALATGEPDKAAQAMSRHIDQGAADWERDLFGGE